MTGTNFTRTMRLKLVKNNKLRTFGTGKFKNKKNKITMYISFMNLLTKEWPEHQKSLWCDWILHWVYNFILRKCSILIFFIPKKPSAYEMSQTLFFLDSLHARLNNHCKAWIIPNYKHLVNLSPWTVENIS